MNNKASSGLIGMAAAFLIGTTVPTLAEEVVVPVMNQADRSSVQNLPRTGQSQAAVRSSQGEPQRIEAPVGEPPISQWHYPNFIVYFEGDHVIHTVMKPNR